MVNESAIRYSNSSGHSTLVPPGGGGVQVSFETELWETLHSIVNCREMPHFKNVFTLYFSSAVFNLPIQILFLSYR